MPAGSLRESYVAALKRMEGVRYVWGGESHDGIDCSGLPRRALRDALLEEGLRTGNGAAFRQWASQWWFDTSAKAMGESYRGFTRPIGISGRLGEVDSNLLQPGDLAVTTGGLHVVVYLGDGEWIQADPRAERVIVCNPEKEKNPWFLFPVGIHRWALLDDQRYLSDGEPGISDIR